MKLGALTCFAVAAMTMTAAVSGGMTRAEVLQFFAQQTPALEQKQELPPAQAAPEAHNTYLVSLQKLATERADPELVRALLNYLVVYRAPENALPATVLGKIFLEQPDVTAAEYRKSPAFQRVMLLPYLTFGFEKAVGDKNPSLPRIVDAKKKYDLLQADTMNARSRDDAAAQ